MLDKYHIYNLGVVKYNLTSSMFIPRLCFRLTKNNFILLDSGNFDYLSSFSSHFLVKTLKSISLIHFNFLIDFFCTHILTSFYQFRMSLQLRNFLSSRWSYTYVYHLRDYTTNFSSSTIFQSSLWLEREIYDLFGVFSINHPNLRRILTDYGFKGFPLRKDFPVFGFKELIYDYECKQLLYSNIRFTQSFRFYFFVRQWKKSN